MVNKINTKINVACGTIKLNENELTIIQTMRQKIGTNLFADGANKGGARENDTKLIDYQLQKTFLEIKRENKGVDMSETINQQIDKMVGTVEKGWSTTTRTGLTELYYQNSSYTNAG